MSVLECAATATVLAVAAGGLWYALDALDEGSGSGDRVRQQLDALRVRGVESRQVIAAEIARAQTAATKPTVVPQSVERVAPRGLEMAVVLADAAAASGLRRQHRRDWVGVDRQCPRHARGRGRHEAVRA